MVETTGSLIERLSALFQACELWYGQGTDNAWDEASALVLGYLGRPWQVAVESRNETLNSRQCAELEALARRRIEERIPVPYLTGEAWFLGQRYLMQPGIVIPRSPIAELIDKRFVPWISQPPLRILDLCTGCGCIGIACAHTFYTARVDLVDIDPGAVALCKKNIALHGVDAQVAAIQSDLFEALPATRYDLIVTNPPYVNKADYAAAPKEFSHEPVHGLYSGSDGLDVLRRILTTAGHWLAQDGLLVGEAGYSRAALSRQFATLPFTWPYLERGGFGVFVLEAGLLSV